jgi:hypothetical protein
MAIATYTDIQGQITNWMANAGLSGQAADFITLAEATLNRELGAVEVDQSLTGTVSSNVIDISTYSVVEPIALFVAETGMDEVLVTPQAEGTYPVSATEGYPQYWSIDGTNINFDCPLDQAYPFRFRYRQRFSLSDANPTNWLLTNHPDVYLAAVLVWSGMYKRNQDIPSNMSAVLSAGIPAVKREIAQRKRGTLKVDPALLRSGRLSYQQWANWP